MTKGFILLFLVALLASACSNVKSQLPAVDDGLDPTPIPFQSTSYSSGIQGRLVPARYSELFFSTKGQVAEVLVQENQAVKEGDVIARLKNRENLDVRASAAKLALLVAQHNYDTLFTDLPANQMKALDDLKAAQEALAKAEATAGILNNEATGMISEMEVARANLNIAKFELDQANYLYKPYASLSETSYTRSTLLVAVVEAQEKYNLALATWNDLVAASESGDQTSQALNEVMIAMALVDKTQARYNLLLAGPDPAELEIATAQVDAAQKELLAAQAAMDGLELRAPMDGVVVNLNVAPGQYVDDGQILLMVVDYSQWYIETDLLVESQVATLAPGQTMTVVPASLPGAQMVGVVETISSVFQEKDDEMLYVARIRVDNVDTRLRWGTNVSVNLEAP